MMQDKRSLYPLPTVIGFMTAISKALAGKVTLWSNAEVCVARWPHRSRTARSIVPRFQS